MFLENQDLNRRTEKARAAPSGENEPSLIPAERFSRKKNRGGLEGAFVLGSVFQDRFSQYASASLALRYRFCFFPCLFLMLVASHPMNPKQLLETY